jgi:hypothetical protein
MKKMDYILTGFIACLALGIFLYNLSLFNQVRDGEAKVIIRVDGKAAASYSLDEDQVIEVGEEGTSTYNVITISNRQVSMTQADCNDQICVKTHEIDRHGQNIVCLPNRVVVEIRYEDVGEGEAEVDAISQ